MRRFDDVLSAYERTDAFFRSAIASALNVDPSKAEEIAVAKSINDQAYFLLLFAQFEDLIKEHVTDRLDAAARASGMSLAEGQMRNLLARTDWRSRLALLTDVIGADNHRVILAMTRDRNDIAHGTLLTSGIDLTERATLLKGVAALITQDPP